MAFTSTDIEALRTKHAAREAAKEHEEALESLTEEERERIYLEEKQRREGTPESPIYVRRAPPTKDDWLTGIRNGAIVLFLFMVAGFIWGALGKQPTPQPPVASLTAKELYAAYMENEVAADVAYKGKVLEVTGKVIATASSAIGPYALLDNGRPASSVQCFFPESLAPQVAALHKGDTITVHSIGDGMMWNVFLKQCRHLQ
jgi:hypothetical protein